MQPTDINCSKGSLINVHKSVMRILFRTSLFFYQFFVLDFVWLFNFLSAFIFRIFYWHTHIHTLFVWHNFGDSAIIHRTFVSMSWISFFLQFYCEIILIPKRIKSRMKGNTARRTIFLLNKTIFFIFTFSFFGSNQKCWYSFVFFSTLKL